MQVVVANGTIVNANETFNADLFRALKGGQSNFGIVTRFDIKTHPQAEFWGGALQYSESADEAQLSAFTKFKTDPYDPMVEIEQTYVYFGALQTYLSTNNLFYTEAVANASALDIFTDIQPQTGSTLRLARASEFAEELEELQPKDQLCVSPSSLIFLPQTAYLCINTGAHQRGIFNPEFSNI
jgi:FAD/FMN-containing dehydrogenase